MSAERPLEECLAEFWLAPDEPEPPHPVGPDALEPLGRPDVTVRGRNLHDLLRPAYDELRSGR
ncbi:hypothetical protein CLV35_2788 [Motilibacter peucedani]|uniref:Uncharacterized protein n=1 Tax=Motilibacter peucedani TaxID=598650 RepID=A0A420XMQ2_9ACTN|nr:hypothetical protein [Motilibacter peucedani]RKS72542.1 hypothetical protein CLV35_2788 [Motilibacter peucedani]